MTGPICPACGHLNPLGAEWCESCARRLPTAAADRPVTGYDRAREERASFSAGEGASRRWVTVAIVLGVAGLVVGATALILPLAVPGYPGSLNPRAPQTIYDKRLDAPIRQYCTAYNQMGNCVRFATAVVGFDNLTVPGANGTLGVVNVSFTLNHSCDACLFEMFRGNLSTGPVFAGGFSSILVAVNGSGDSVGVLLAGAVHLILVNDQFGAYAGPVSLQLSVVYLGTLSYR